MSNPSENGINIALYALQDKKLYRGDPVKVSESEKEKALKLSLTQAVRLLVESTREQDPTLTNEQIIEGFITSDMEHEVVHEMICMLLNIDDAA
jgi:hypothetical protein